MRQGVIAAISTPPGKGGVALIRMSGEGAFDIAKRVFFPKSKKALGDYPPRTQIYGCVIYNNEEIDDGMLTLFPSPHSYTGEDTVEICCHGGRLVTSLVLEALLANGAIPAEAGEFTRRAFINGRLSLTAAEAIGTLLEAKSREQLRLSSKPARSRLDREIASLREDITDVLSSIYARIDYPDEDLGDFTDEETVARLERVKERLVSLCDTYRTGRAITEGVTAVICGKPNVGKSTLYNLLLGEDAAIVTDIAGTTRDILERTVPLGRVMLRLYDTAGIREGASLDAVERIGIERTLSHISDADLVLAVFDLSRPHDSEDERILHALKDSKGAKICILNKADNKAENATRAEFDSEFDEIITISAKADEQGALVALRDTVDRLFTDERISTLTDPIVASARQHASLLAALEAVDSAIGAYRLGFPADAASSDIDRALSAISEVDGRGVSEQVTADIFSKFCVGK